MPRTEASSDETCVLFIDIIGCSKLLIAEHSDQIQELKESYAKENSFA